MKNTILPFFFTMLLFSCNKDDNQTPPPTSVKKWTIPLSAKYESPAPGSRSETGTAILELFSDNSLKYSISVIGLSAADALNAAHLHVGNVISNGSVILDLSPSFAAGTATGTISNLRTSLVDSLKSDINEIYINAHSTQVASGLIRGQLNATIEMAADVIMNGANEVPAGTTVATGLALLRLTTAKQLYTKVTVSNLEAADALTLAHIHKGAAGANGSVMIPIYSSAAEFGTVKTVTVDDPTFASLKNDALYFNAHSTSKPGGIVRGQIR